MNVSAAFIRSCYF